MSAAWHIETLADGTGVIEHRSAPRFRALWTTGLEDLASLTGPFWIDEGQDEEDAVTFHAFRWTDSAPDQESFEGLMREAALQIDDWIARRL